MEPYLVPFELDRSRAPRYLLINRGPDVLRGVSVLVSGPGLLVVTPPIPLRPTFALQFDLEHEHLELATTMVARWLRPDGFDYLWRAAF